MILAVYSDDRLWSIVEIIEDNITSFKYIALYTSFKDIVDYTEQIQYSPLSEYIKNNFVKIISESELEELKAGAL